MDNVDTLIIERLGEHQRKVDFVVKNMKKNGPNRHAFGKSTYVILSVAACLALILAVSPIFKDNSIADMAIPSPAFDGYRGSGDNDIERLINDGDYEKALVEVQKELTILDHELTTFDTPKASSEESEYIKSLYISEKDELLWCKIYILVRLDKKSEVENVCLNYLDDAELTAHRKDVERTLKEIQ